MKTILIMFLLLSSGTAVVSDEDHTTADPAVSAARDLFRTMIRLADNFDAALAELYAEDGRVITDRKYPTGETKTLEIPATQWKELVRSLMPAAKARGDRSKFSNVEYKREGSNVRITATRHSVLKGYSGPYALLVGPDQGGDWKILEERIYTQPF